jgi:hypothetical protein
MDKQKPAVMVRAMIPCAHCGCFSAWGCAILCGDPDVPPQELDGLIRVKPKKRPPAR